MRTIVAALLGAAVAIFATAAPAHAAVWVVSSGAKIVPGSTPGTAGAVSPAVPGPAASVSLSAARNEYEAAQIAVSGTADRPVTVSWDATSDPLLVSSSQLFKVGYVRITRPSTGVGSRPGLYPDPLLPAAFGVPVALPGGANAFYLRLHVPADAPAGDYIGTLIVDDPGDQAAAGYPAAPVSVPVRLTVYDFALNGTTLSTAFPWSIDYVMDSVRDVVADGPAERAALSDRYYRFWADHDISPTLFQPPPAVDRTTGAIVPSTADAYSPYLNGGYVSPGLFADSAFPLQRNWPWPGLSVEAVTPQLTTYLDALFRLYVASGWQDRGYLYVWDEPDYAHELETAQLATLAHRVSAPLGFRARVLITDWPRTKAAAGLKANSFLFDQVDIWCPSVYHYFDSLPALELRRAAGSQTWWYSYASFDPGSYPTFLIDKPLTDERAVPWMTWRWDATGFLYWGTTRWGNAVTGNGYRDPYLDPVSYASSKGFVANGEASLVYPGYEPALGLNDPTAGPVSSLRLETLRDGIEDYDYLSLAAGASGNEAAGKKAAARRGAAVGQAAAAVQQVAEAISDYRYGAVDRFTYRDMPAFSTDQALYDAARAHLASYIERKQDGLPPVSVTGTVTDGAGRPVPGARVTDGVVSTTTDPQGAFTLAGVLPSWRLTVSHPLYVAAIAHGSGDDATLAVSLAPRTTTLLIASFDARVGFAASKGVTAVPETTAVTSGRAGVSLTLRGGRAAATMSLPPGRRDLHHFRTLGLDAFSAGALDHQHPWFVLMTLTDSHKKVATQAFLLCPGGWTHLAFSLRGHGLDLRHLARVGLKVTGGTHRFSLDTLIAS